MGLSPGPGPQASPCVRPSARGRNWARPPRPVCSVRAREHPEGLHIQSPGPTCPVRTSPLVPGPGSCSWKAAGGHSVPLATEGRVSRLGLPRQQPAVGEACARGQPPRDPRRPPATESSGDGSPRLSPGPMLPRALTGGTDEGRPQSLEGSRQGEFKRQFPGVRPRPELKLRSLRKERDLEVFIPLSNYRSHSGS